jgi:hypothetical protein
LAQADQGEVLNQMGDAMSDERFVDEANSKDKPGPVRRWPLA